MKDNIYEVEASEKDKNKRLDKFLAENFSENLSRSLIQKAISSGGVTVNGVVAKNSYKMRPGDRARMAVEFPEPFTMKAEDIPLDILYEDEYLIVVNKPAGMVTHPAPGNYTGTLANALLGHCGRLSKEGGAMKPGIVHRLDKGTSGLMVAAKTDQSHRFLAKQFKDKTITRRYIAIVRGKVELDNGIIELPIGRSHYDRKKMAIKYEEGSRTAITQYKVLKRMEAFTILELTPGTGRTHQLRVHLAHIGHPVVGDDMYGQKDGMPRPALHAKTLGFIHPVTGKYMSFESELPADMKELIEKGRL